MLTKISLLDLRLVKIVIRISLVHGSNLPMGMQEESQIKDVYWPPLMAHTSDADSGMQVTSAL